MRNVAQYIIAGMAMQRGLQPISAFPVRGWHYFGGRRLLCSFDLPSGLRTNSLRVRRHEPCVNRASIAAVPCRVRPSAHWRYAETRNEFARGFILYIEEVL